MNDRNADDLVRACLEADTVKRNAAHRTEALLSSFHAVAKDDIARAIADHNASGRGDYVYGEHETTVAIALVDGAPVMCVTVDLGAFSRRDTGRQLTPREAWDHDERALTGDLLNHLANHLLWVARCRVEIHPPLDYDLMTADPEL